MFLKCEFFSLEILNEFDYYELKHPLPLPQNWPYGEIQAMLHSLKTDLLLYQCLSRVSHDSECKGYWWMRWLSPKGPVFHCHVHVFFLGGGQRAESAFCIRYWFLIRGPRYKHLSMLYTVPAQLRILFAALSALWKWIMCRWESRLKCGQQRTFPSGCAPSKPFQKKARSAEGERERKCVPFPACIAY